MTTTKTGHTRSIIALIEDARNDPATFRTKATRAPWESAAEPVPVAPAASCLLTIAQAAEVVPLSAKQLYRVAERADSPFRKVEGRLMAYEDALHRWIKAHPTGSSKPAESPAPDGDSLADRVRRRRREGGAS